MVCLQISQCPAGFRAAGVDSRASGLECVELITSRSSACPDAYFLFSSFSQVSLAPLNYSLSLTHHRSTQLRSIDRSVTPRFSRRRPFCPLPSFLRSFVLNHISQQLVKPTRPTLSLATPLFLTCNYGVPPPAHQKPLLLAPPPADLSLPFSLQSSHPASTLSALCFVGGIYGQCISLLPPNTYLVILQTRFDAAGSSDHSSPRKLTPPSFFFW